MADPVRPREDRAGRRRRRPLAEEVVGPGAAFHYRPARCTGSQRSRTRRSSRSRRRTSTTSCGSRTATAAKAPRRRSRVRMRARFERSRRAGWSGIERAQLARQKGANRGVRRVVDDVSELPGVAPEVVELAPVAVPVGDVEVARRVDRHVRRRPAVYELVLAEVLEEIVAPPRDRARRGGAGRSCRRPAAPRASTPASSLIVEAKSMFRTGSCSTVPRRASRACGRSAAPGSTPRRARACRRGGARPRGSRCRSCRRSPCGRAGCAARVSRRSRATARSSAWSDSSWRLRTSSMYETPRRRERPLCHALPRLVGDVRLVRATASAKRRERRRTAPTSCGAGIAGQVRRDRCEVEEERLAARVRRKSTRLAREHRRRVVAPACRRSARAGRSRSACSRSTAPAGRCPSPASRPSPAGRRGGRRGV